MTEAETALEELAAKDLARFLDHTLLAGDRERRDATSSGCATRLGSTASRRSASTGSTSRAARSD